MEGYTKGTIYFFLTLTVCAVVFILGSIIYAKTQNSSLLETFRNWFGGVA